MPSGVYVANTTPFMSDADYSVDKVAYMSHVAWLQEAGVDGVVPFGTNGEGPLCSLEEKLDTLQALSSEFSDLDIIPTVTEQSLPEARRAVRELSSLPVEAILILPPYYYRSYPSEGLRRFLDGILEVTHHPIALYNIPKYAVYVDPELVESLSVWGVKDSSGDDSYSEQILAAGKGVLAGTEEDLWASLERGVHGSISALANFVPEMVVELFAAFRTSDKERGLKISTQLQHIRAETKRFPTPAVLKYLAAHRHGTDMGTVRPPLSPMPADHDLGSVLDAASLRTNNSGD